MCNVWEFLHTMIEFAGDLEVVGPTRDSRFQVYLFLWQIMIPDSCIRGTFYSSTEPKTAWSMRSNGRLDNQEAYLSSSWLQRFEYWCHYYRQWRTLLKVQGKVHRNLCLKVRIAFNQSQPSTFLMTLFRVKFKEIVSYNSFLDHIPNRKPPIDLSSHLFYPIITFSICILHFTFWGNSKVNSDFENFCR
jgi:hypothetical protein